MGGSAWGGNAWVAMHRWHAWVAVHGVAPNNVAEPPHISFMATKCIGGRAAIGHECGCSNLMWIGHIMLPHVIVCGHVWVMILSHLSQMGVSITPSAHAQVPSLFSTIKTHSVPQTCKSEGKAAAHKACSPCAHIGR